MAMHYLFQPPTPLEYFGALVQSDAQLHLLETAASLGQDEYPELDVQQVLAEVDLLLARLRQRLPADAPALHRLRMLNHYFFEELHFRGNLNHYYDPDNSCLHRVLARRCGIPISLAVLWLELAQGLGLAACGVGFPGHFLVRVSLPQGQVLMDPLTGESLSREELQERLETWHASQGLRLDPGLSLGAWLQAAPAREIIARMLRNLKEIHHAQRDWARLVAVENRLLVLLPHAWSEYRDRGLAHAELGQLAPAVKDLQTYLDNSDGGDVSTISQRLTELRRALS